MWTLVILIIHMWQVEGVRGAQYEIYLCNSKQIQFIYYSLPNWAKPSAWWLCPPHPGTMTPFIGQEDALTIDSWMTRGGTKCKETRGLKCIIIIICMYVQIFSSLVLDQEWKRVRTPICFSLLSLCSLFALVTTVTKTEILNVTVVSITKRWHMLHGGIIFTSQRCQLPGRSLGQEEN